jgi:hypothetical protein
MNRSIMRGMEGAQAHLFDMKTLNSQEGRLYQDVSILRFSEGLSTPQVIVILK